MKTFKAVEKLSHRARAAIENAIKRHDEYKSAYFWTPGANAGARRNNEIRAEVRHPEFAIVTANSIIKVRPSYQESAKHCYYDMGVYVDGERKDIRALKRLLK